MLPPDNPSRFPLIMTSHPLFAIAALLLSPLALSAQSPLQKKDVTPAPPKNLETKLPPGYTIPIVDISGEADRQVVVDREAGEDSGVIRLRFLPSETRTVMAS